MEISDFKKIIDHESRVRIQTNNGKTYTGIITGVENGFDTFSGMDEIELDIGSCYLGIEIPDIIIIERIESRSPGGGMVEKTYKTRECDYDTKKQRNCMAINQQRNLNKCGRN